ncbi:hypothetical protein BKA69DRAFT_1101455, partial [Paraphysoderma sedebokerense]
VISFKKLDGEPPAYRATWSDDDHSSRDVFPPKRKARNTKVVNRSFTTIRRGFSELSKQRCSEAAEQFEYTNFYITEDSKSQKIKDSEIKANVRSTKTSNQPGNNAISRKKSLRRRTTLNFSNAGRSPSPLHRQNPLSRAPTLGSADSTSPLNRTMTASASVLVDKTNHGNQSSQLSVDLISDIDEDYEYCDENGDIITTPDSTSTVLADSSFVTKPICVRQTTEKWLSIQPF